MYEVLAQIFFFLFSPLRLLLSITYLGLDEVVPMLGTGGEASMIISMRLCC